MALSNAKLRSESFQDSLKDVERNDLVFIDPPYTITHNNNGFIKYNQKLFKEEDQITLAENLLTIKEIGASYIMTNADHPRVKEIFDNGDIQRTYYRASLVGGRNAKREKYEELIVTNIDI